MIHDFDMARFLLGEEPVEVHAVGVLPGRPGDRRGRRRRHRRRAAQDRVRARSRRSRTRAAPPTATTSASRCMAASACWPPETSTPPPSSWPMPAGYQSDPALPFFLERYAEAYRPSSTRSLRRCSTAPRLRPPARTASRPSSWPTRRRRRRGPAASRCASGMSDINGAFRARGRGRARGRRSGPQGLRATRYGAHLQGTAGLRPGDRRGGRAGDPRARAGGVSERPVLRRGGRRRVRRRDVWVVDPIDGTANFARRIPHWCISIAFVRDMKTEVGVIYQPPTDEMYAAPRAAARR